MLVGFMGAGKSTVGRALAARLGCAFEDLDQRVERREGRTVAEIFRTSGEADFRRAERAALLELLDELGSARKVVALGGGAFAQAANIQVIHASGIATVFLDAPVEELWRRCAVQNSSEATERPLLSNWESFRSLYQARRPHYLKATHHQETGGREIGEIATQIIEILSLEKGK